MAAECSVTLGCLAFYLLHIKDKRLIVLEKGGHFFKVRTLWVASTTLKDLLRVKTCNG